MSKLKDAMIQAEEQFWNENTPDLSMDKLISEDVFFRYGVDLDIARSLQNLMALTPPTEALYLTHPEIYDLWWNIFLANDDSQHDGQLELWEGQYYG